MEKLITYGLVLTVLANIGNALRFIEFKSFKEFISSFKRKVGDVYFPTWFAWRNPL